MSDEITYEMCLAHDCMKAIRELSRDAEAIARGEQPYFRRRTAGDVYAEARDIYGRGKAYLEHDGIAKSSALGYLATCRELAEAEGRNG